MRTATQVHLTPGRVYRTDDLARWGANPTRLAQRMVGGGQLQRLATGYYYARKQSKFGAVPPAVDALLRALLKGDAYVLTGSDRWNALGLGATAVLSTRVVYNRKRSGEFTLGGVRMHLRRVDFPNRPTQEWYVVDLLENLDLAGTDASTVEANLERALTEGRFDLHRLREMAARFGTHRTRELVERAASEVQVP